MGSRLTLARRTFLYLAFTLSVGSAGAYAVTLVHRSRKVYSFLKSDDHRGLRGRLHRFDPELGYSARPGAVGFQLVPGSTPLPVSYDREGLRVAQGHEARVPHKRPFVLTLGCSFTFGDATLAEDTYAEVLARRLDGTALNAGKSGYGLAQMLVLARRLIPRYQPDVVVIQFSPWLARRAMSGFANVTFGVAPVPYLTQDDDGRVAVVPPAFAATLFDLPFASFDRPDRGPGEFLSFFFAAGAPLYVHDDVQTLRYRLRRGAGPFPLPASDPERLNRAVYGEIVRLARGQGARPVIVRLSHALEIHHQPMRELSSDALLVDAQAALDAHATDYEDYQRRFAHWGGSTPTLVDPHPNAAAHLIIARQIARALQRPEAVRP
ncbi:MAG: hypothetical protein ABW221_01815 [Vicinamibacteria bacterium]